MKETKDLRAEVIDLGMIGGGVAFPLSIVTPPRTGPPKSPSFGLARDTTVSTGNNGIQLEKDFKSRRKLTITPYRDVAKSKRTGTGDNSQLRSCRIAAAARPAQN